LAPQLPQLPFRQSPPISHIEPAAEHVSSEQQPAFLHVAPAQQLSPGPPQAWQVLVPPSIT
jgi:hypothetical protein